MARVCEHDQGQLVQSKIVFRHTLTACHNTRLSLFHYLLGISIASNHLILPPLCHRENVGKKKFHYHVMVNSRKIYVSPKLT